MTNQHPPITGETPGAAGAGNGSGSGLAVGSLILGILGFCTAGVTGLIALVLGGIALSSGRRQPGGGGRGMAIAGMVIGGISLVVGPVLLLAVLLMPALGKARTNAQLIRAQSDMRQVGFAAQVYAMDFDGCLPPADDWLVAMDGYLLVDADRLTWPGQVEQGRTIAMNEELGGRVLEQTADLARTVLFFECAPGSPPGGGPELLPDVPHSDGHYVVVFADAHVELVSKESVHTLVWDPAEGDAD